MLPKNSDDRGNSGPVTCNFGQNKHVGNVNDENVQCGWYFCFINSALVFYISTDDCIRNGHAV